MIGMIDTTTPFIDIVHVLPKHLAPGDVVHRAACVGRSYTVPAYSFEIETVQWRGRCVTLTVLRLDTQRREVMEYESLGSCHEVVIGGDKILRANMEAGAVKRNIAGLWIWKGGE